MINVNTYIQTFVQALIRFNRRCDIHSSWYYWNDRSDLKRHELPSLNNEQVIGRVALPLATVLEIDQCRIFFIFFSKARDTSIVQRVAKFHVYRDT
jgi:hypothetical protein